MFRRFLFALLLAFSVTATVAHAEDAPIPPTCSVSSANIGPQGKGDVAIGCSGLSEATGAQLAEIMTRILQNRLDPQMVLTKLDDVNRVPDDNVARIVDDSQRQKIIQNLVGKPHAQIAITAHPTVADSAEFARGIATALLQVGWQIEGQQIRRAAPKALDGIPGIAIVVRSQDSPPAKATQLRAALLAANIAAPLAADPTMAPDAALLWIGRRPAFNPAEQPK
jgi:hypothetical protein